MIDVNMKPLPERQAEIDLAILKKLGREAHETFRRGIQSDDIKWTVLLLGRDLWEHFWAVYRDTVEENANRILTKSEEMKKKPPTIFGGFDAG